VAGKRVLDLACGSGRYSRLLAETGAADIVALDFCVPMLRQVSIARRVCGSMLQLPFACESFDVVISGLALGHAASVDEWMAEVFRVLRPGGAVLYSDIHPAAAGNGLTRSFDDHNNEPCTVPHNPHAVDRQKAAAAAAGLRVDIVRELRVGVELRERFANCEEFYRLWDGVPIVLIVRAAK